MKKLLYLITLLYCSNIKAQELSIHTHPKEPESVQHFKKLLQDALKKYKSAIWVPFKENGLMGYMEYQTQEIVVPAMATQLRLIHTAKDSVYFGYMILDRNTFYEFWKDGDGNIRTLPMRPSVVDVTDYRSYEEWANPKEIDAKMYPKEGDFKGFTYAFDSLGIPVLTSYSEIYAKYSKGRPRLYPIVIGNKVVAIAEKPDTKSSNNTAGIIEPNGRALPGFDFGFNKIRPLGGIKKSLGQWFLVRKQNEHNFYFINSDGKWLDTNLIPKADYSQNFVQTQTSAPYYIIANDMGMGYGIKKGKLFDFYELKAVKTFPDDIEILRIEYIALQNIEEMNVEEKRKNTVMFAYVQKGNNPQFYMDFSGKMYSVATIKD